ncbi:putative oxidoreductase [Rubellimicrobium mesophilum DSM 19309]|uniref:Putative oxidoreductase n=1 Tax=Rubellimicrobium mesophilum DSM 19309 TaxID=442562 RepID=A0A017HPR8_9RHOB|nr:FAD-binding oxidoreductase [Rubellimicrobium mesophilum]EYD76138.1 putative oxidoreductase [Rubellimicrobium mesophilum DSM 19309]
MMLSGWGRFPRQECRTSRPRDEAELRAALAQGGAIARGNGRSYGDSALSPRNTVDMRGWSRMLDFEPDTGRLVAEAGVVLGDVVAAFLPRGWFPSVTPGTKFVTLGGMIAADVHGKNHHRDGSFGAFVDWIDVMGPDGEVTRCSRDESPDLFHWTLGGMGLTGVILRAAFRLRRVESAWIRQTMVPAPGLDAAIDAMEAARDSTYSVAWIDCLSRGEALGRSLVMLGEHAAWDDLDRTRRDAPFVIPERRRLRVPMDLPSVVLGGASLRAFNALYYRNGARKRGESLVDWDGFFYPLDAIHDWNRIYGRRGFAQFQCVLPLDASRHGMRALLRAISDAGTGSFLAVLKRLGPGGAGMSFPMEGYTLALDFPVTEANLRLLDGLDRIVLDHGGRFYLAKDSRMTRATLRRADPRADLFQRLRQELRMTPSFASAQSERLGL